MTQLENLDVREMADDVRDADAVVVGSGVAGLMAALRLAPRRVTLVTKTALERGGSSSWAQGGVAAAMDASDSPAEHAHDTLAAGAGICDEEAVDVLTREGPERIRELIELGARFDRRRDGSLALGREGAHGRRRILHAGGDATGAEMVRALVEAVRRAEHVTVVERAFVHDLVLAGDEGSSRFDSPKHDVGYRDVPDRCLAGVLARHDDGRTVWHRAPAVVLATGGFGQVFARTTNPPAVTGDGLALAARAGARLADLEFVQFHPTALDVDADPLPLVTEALRGEGAVLRNGRGERFMVAVHPRAELAPRDIVAREIRRQQCAGERVVLDAVDAVGDAFAERFPTVDAHCRRHGIDPSRQPIPVTPAAHYAMAGVDVDTFGRASLGGLWVCGEAASSGLHGANRLASNSLLEALIFGARVAESIHLTPITPWQERPTMGSARREIPPLSATPPSRKHAEETAARVRRILWEQVGLVRERDGLLDARDALARLVAPPESEAASLLTVGRLITAAALAREESRGAHFRADFPDTRAELAERRTWIYDPSAEGVLRRVDTNRPRALESFG